MPFVGTENVGIPVSASITWAIAGIALEEIAKRFVKDPEKQDQKDSTSKAVNLLGVTPLDFGAQENVEILKQNLQKCGWEVMSSWAMGDDLETLQRSAQADVNLVVSAVGLRAAKILWKTYVFVNIQLFDFPSL